MGESIALVVAIPSSDRRALWAYLPPNQNGYSKIKFKTAAKS